MHPHITMVTLGVADIARSRAFHEALGWTAAPSSTDEVVFFQSAGTILGLFGRAALAKDAAITPPSPEQAPTAPRPHTIALAHNVPDRATVDDVHAEAIAAGATSLKPPQEVFWGGRSGYFADPDGHLWEIAHDPFAGLTDDGHMILDI